MVFRRFLNFIGIFLLAILLCGCDKERPVILFNNQPITTATLSASTTRFELGETTHYVIFNPKGFESPYLRVQVIDKNRKTKNWGYNINRAQNLKIDTSKKYYIDSIAMHKRGLYIVSVYYLHDLARPLVQGAFTVE